MISDRLQHILDEIAKLPLEEQDRVAAAMQVVLEQPPVTSDAIRPVVMNAFEQVMTHSTEVLDYLRDK